MRWKGGYNAVKWSPLGAETADEAVFWDIGRLLRANFSGSRPEGLLPIPGCIGEALERLLLQPSLGEL